MMVASNSSTRSSSVSCFISRKYLGTLHYSSVDCIFTISNTVVSGLRKWSDAVDAKQVIGIVLPFFSYVIPQKVN